MAEVYSAIQAKSVVNIEYIKFNDSQKRKVIISPYLLKEYNRRWYIIGAAYDTGRILNFALDRILAIKVLTGHKYTPVPDDLNERYEDIIGITYNEESPLYEIIFWASDASAPYIRTKPLHGSQKELKGGKEKALQEQYSLPEAGALFSIECRRNYELIRELTSFTDIKIISPESIINVIKTRIKKLYQNYF